MFWECSGGVLGMFLVLYSPINKSLFHVLKANDFSCHYLTYYLLIRVHFWAQNYSDELAWLLYGPKRKCWRVNQYFIDVLNAEASLHSISRHHLAACCLIDCWRILVYSWDRESWIKVQLLKWTNSEYMNVYAPNLHKGRIFCLVSDHFHCKKNCMASKKFNHKREIRNMNRTVQILFYNALQSNGTWLKKSNIKILPKDIRREFLNSR